MQILRTRPRLDALLFLAGSVGLGVTAPAQRVPVLPATTLRFELGMRLRALEAAIERHGHRANALQRAMPIVDESVRAFFGLSLDRAAERLDAARFALETAEELELSHARLAFLPEKRLIDPGTVDALTIEHGWVYGHRRGDEQSFGAEGLRYRIEHTLVAADGEVISGPAGAEFEDLRPGTTRLTVPELQQDLDLVLLSTITPLDRQGQPSPSAPLITRRRTVSFVRDAEARCAALETVEETARTTGHSTSAATVSQYARMFRVLAKGRALETDIPVAKLLAEAESIAEHLGSGAGPYFARPRTGERWIQLSVPLEGSTSREGVVPLRLWTPPDVEEDARVPLVIALHGAGGSENMFFDGYGDGLAYRLAAERGWAFVAPRTQSDTAALLSMIDELARRYPIDPSKVLLLGHSMGAAKVVDLLQAGPGRFAAAAVMGGGGRIRSGSTFDELPVLVGCGSRDFALESARSLNERLERSGAQSELRIYEGIEHLTVVQIGLPDVYALFDRVVTN